MSRAWCKLAVLAAVAGSFAIATSAMAQSGMAPRRVRPTTAATQEGAEGAATRPAGSRTARRPVQKKIPEAAQKVVKALGKGV